MVRFKKRYFVVEFERLKNLSCEGEAELDLEPVRGRWDTEEEPVVWGRDDTEPSRVQPTDSVTSF